MKQHRSHCRTGQRRARRIPIALYGGAELPAAYGYLRTHNSPYPWHPGDQEEQGGQRMSDFKVLGVRVNAVQIPDVVETLCRWIHERASSRFVAVTGMHGV